MKYIEGKQYTFHEMGVKWKVTLIKLEKKGNKNNFELRIDEIVSMGSMKPEAAPKVGTHINVMSTDGYEHYAGWNLRDL